MFNPFVRREQPEGQQYLPSAQAKLLLVPIRGDEWHVGNPVRDEIDLGRWRVVHLLQDGSSPFRHDHQPSRVDDQFPHHAVLVGVGRAENGMERGDDRRGQSAQQDQ